MLGCGLASHESPLPLIKIRVCTVISMLLGGDWQLHCIQPDRQRLASRKPDLEELRVSLSFSALAAHPPEVAVTSRHLSQ